MLILSPFMGIPPLSTMIGRWRGKKGSFSFLLSRFSGWIFSGSGNPDPATVCSEKVQNQEIFFGISLNS